MGMWTSSQYQIKQSGINFGTSIPWHSSFLKRYIRALPNSYDLHKFLKECMVGYLTKEETKNKEWQIYFYTTIKSINSAQTDI